MRQIDMHIDYHVRAQWWKNIRDRPTCQSRPTLPSWRLLHWQYGIICHKNSLIRQCYHFTTDFDHVLLQLMDIMTPCLNTETFELLSKSCAKFLFMNRFNVQLHVYLKKLTLKFKLLYLLNYVCCVNKICRI